MFRFWNFSPVTFVLHATTEIYFSSASDIKQNKAKCLINKNVTFEIGSWAMENGSLFRRMKIIPEVRLPFFYHVVDVFRPREERFLARILNFPKGGGGK